MVSLVESLGLDVTYTTNIDVPRAAPLIARPSGRFFPSGTTNTGRRPMRDGVESARDHGVNLAFLGGQRGISPHPTRPIAEWA